MNLFIGSPPNLVVEEAIKFDNDVASTSASLTRTRVRRQDSGCNRSRGNEKHITPDDLEKMVITIKEEKDLEPLTMSNQPYIAPLASEATPSQFSNTKPPIVFTTEPEKVSTARSSPQKSSNHHWWEASSIRTQRHQCCQRIFPLTDLDVISINIFSTQFSARFQHEARSVRTGWLVPVRQQLASSERHGAPQNGQDVLQHVPAWWVVR
jgi:hypothetical protein